MTSLYLFGSQWDLRGNLLIGKFRGNQILTRYNILRYLNKLDDAKKKLEEFRRPMIDGLIVRSRVAWHEQGERSSKYFWSLEKRNGSIKSIQYIEKENKVLSNTKTIINEFSSHMEAKYRKNLHNETDEEFISSNVKTTLTSNERLLLDSGITLDELSEALHGMKKGKTPGSNGFPVEFFKIFWNELGPFLLRAVNESLIHNVPLPSHREGIIKLIPKQGKSPHEMKGWRPITLLNVDYKIVSAAIANRLKKVIDHIISPCQTAYIAGRFIGENTRLLFDTISYANENEIEGMILAADFEAAFESISWEYLRTVMAKMNFGSKFLKLIDFLYLNPNNYSRIMINGHLGPKIFLQRGIRQGDPSSGYLFDIAVEVLSSIINESNKLSGVNISPDKQIRISQYADDTILLLDGSTKSLNGALDELINFANLSGLHINLEKTSCLPIGTKRKRSTPKSQHQSCWGIDCSWSQGIYQY